MLNPFFSIVIPTRGRPRLLADAIASAVQQDFDDFEVIVSDNFNGPETRQTVEKFLQTSALRYFRTEKLLSMPDHWEFATQQAKGEYVLILTDRSVLRQGALRFIHDAISANDKRTELCAWRWTLYENSIKGDVLRDLALTKESTVQLKSKAIAINFATGSKGYPYSLPRGLNSCYHKDLIYRVRQRWGSPFKPLTPDFFSAFVFLSCTEDVLFLDRPLFISQGLKDSNGGNAYRTSALAYLESLGITDWLLHTPIKAPLVENTIFQDFLAAKELCGGNLANINIHCPCIFRLVSKS